MINNYDDHDDDPGGDDLDDDHDDDTASTSLRLSASCSESKTPPRWLRQILQDQLLRKPQTKRLLLGRGSRRRRRPRQELRWLPPAGIAGWLFKFVTTVAFVVVSIALLAVVFVGANHRYCSLF